MALVVNFDEGYNFIVTIENAEVDISEEFILIFALRGFVNYGCKVYLWLNGVVGWRYGFNHSEIFLLTFCH